jgi:hypothetical protein
MAAEGADLPYLMHMTAMSCAMCQVHYGVPEGSYATQPDGAPRIREFREMITALHAQVR